MTRAEWLALAERIEAAAGAVDQGIRIIEAAEAIADWEQWRINLVHRLCEAGGFLDAAASLVPGGWAWSLYSGARDEGRATAYCVPRGGALPWPEWVTDIEGATPALALAAAACRAQAEDADE